MANFGIYAPRGNLSSLKVGEAASPTSYSSIAKSQSYSLAGTSTEEVKLEYSSAQTFNCVAITGLDSFPTVTIEKTLSAVDTTLGTVSGSTYAATARARGTFNALLIFSDESADDLTITFSTPYPTGFRTVFAGYLLFQPTTNFDELAGFNEVAEFDSLSTRSSDYSVMQKRLREFSPVCTHLSDDEFFNVNFVRYTLGDSVCLVALDTADTSPEKWFIGNLVKADGNLVASGQHSQSMLFRESDKWS